jgi:hypothetical protein
MAGSALSATTGLRRRGTTGSKTTTSWRSLIGATTPSFKLEIYLVGTRLPMQAPTWSIGAIFIACQNPCLKNSKASLACSMSRT